MPCTSKVPKILHSPLQPGLGFSILLYSFPSVICLCQRLTTLQGKAKIDAWEKIVDEGVTAEQAQETYAVLVDSLKVKYGFGTR